MRYLIALSTITTIVALTYLLRYFGWHGFYAGYAVGASGMLYYHFMLRAWELLVDKEEIE